MGSGTIYKRGSVYWIGYVGTDGNQYCESSRSKVKADAIRLLDVRSGAVANGSPVTPALGRLTFADAMADLINDYSTNRRKSWPDVTRRIELHLTPYFGAKRRMASISTADVRKYIAHRQTQTEAVWRAHTVTLADGRKLAVPEKRREIGRPPTAAQINRELAALKRAFTLAIQAGKLLHKPHIPMLEERNVRKGFFEKAQYVAVRSHLPEELRGIATFSYITGWRVRSEVLPLQWRQVDFESGEIRLDAGTTKNDEARTFIMTTDLRKELERLRKVTQEIERAQGKIIRWVFHRDGEQIKTFYGAWRSACKSAGVPGRILHDFRRTAVRNLVRAGVPERVAMQMTGHKTRSVFERYNIVSESDLREAARKLQASYA